TRRAVTVLRMRRCRCSADGWRVPINFFGSLGCATFTEHNEYLTESTIGEEHKARGYRSTRRQCPPLQPVLYAADRCPERWVSSKFLLTDRSTRAVRNRAS